MRGDFVPSCQFSKRRSELEKPVSSEAESLTIKELTSENVTVNNMLYRSCGARDKSEVLEPTRKLKSIPIVTKPAMPGEPLPQSKTSITTQVAIHYQGNFTLPYSVQCSRSNLPPGKYSIAVDFERGKTVRVTLSRQGHIVKIEGITQRQSPHAQRAGRRAQGSDSPALIDQGGTVGPGLQPDSGF